MITVSDLHKTFKDGEVETHVLKGITLAVKEKALVAIMGRSGAGKSTLLYQMSLLDDPTSGEVVIDGEPAAEMSSQRKTQFRLTHCGYVFQDYALLPDLTALENTLLPLLMQGTPLAQAREQACGALEKVGLSHRLYNLPSALSGGEQQRVSIARAVAHKPKILFADEPTANLDRESARTVLDIFKELHKNGQTIIMVTHEKEYARQAGRIITIDDGVVVSDK